jgi:hypothetical protein
MMYGSLPVASGTGNGNEDDAVGEGEVKKGN